MQEYRFSDALKQFQVVIDSQRPLRGLSMQNAAMVATGLGQFELAATLYDRATALGATNLFDGRAGLYLAERESGKAFDALSPDLSHDVSQLRSEEHTSELQSLMRISYAVFCLKKKIYNI